MTIIEAMEDKKLFANFFPNPADWAAWKVFLKALFALPLNPVEMTLFTYHTGRETAPTTQAREAWLVVGRRGGKSRIASLIAAYLGAFIDYREYLAPGELAFIPIVAVDKKQARQIFRFLETYFAHCPMLKKLVKRKSAGNEWFLELSTRVQIEVFAGSFRSSRGFTIAAFLADEIAYWQSDEHYSNPDSEILKSVRPGGLTIPNALLLCMSSPYARQGELWRAYDRYYGKDNPDVLVWQGTTEEMHPSVNAAAIQKERDEDPDAAAAEYDAQFRKDIESFVSRETLDAAIIPQRAELPSYSGARYVGFCDPSGGSQDSFTLAIAHREEQRIVLDVVREVRPPFSPEGVVEQFCAVLKAYRVHVVTGDRYGGEWPREQFRKHGVMYEVADKVKSDIYTECLPLLNSGKVELLDHARLKAQLLGLERRTGRSGKDSIDHAPKQHDDLANSVAGAVVAAASGAHMPIEYQAIVPRDARFSDRGAY